VDGGPGGRPAGWAEPGKKQIARESVKPFQGRGGGGLEDKVQELCEAYVDQTNNLLKILKSKGYLPKSTPYFDIPDMSNEGLDDALDKLMVDIETNPLAADLEILPSLKEIMGELDGAQIHQGDSQKIQSIPKVLKALKEDNSKLIALQKSMNNATKVAKKSKSTLDALLERF
jgi:hypothetical protein